MLHKNKFVSELAAVSSSGAMEADTISKNGQSSKSQMSRRNILQKIYIVFLLFVSSFLLSCSSAESDGIKAAKEHCKCNQINRQKREDLNKKYNEGKFSSDGQAMQELERISKEHSDCSKKAYEFENKLRNKYRTNKDKDEKFSYTYYRFHCI